MQTLRSARVLSWLPLAALLLVGWPAAMADCCAGHRTKVVAAPSCCDGMAPGAMCAMHHASAADDQQDGPCLDAVCGHDLPAFFTRPAVAPAAPTTLAALAAPAAPMVDGAHPLRIASSIPLTPPPRAR